MSAGNKDITELLGRVSSGEVNAASELFPLVYEELHSLAAAYFARERQDHTLQPTAIVHEAFMRLAGSREQAWNDRAHFFRAAALAMRRVLVNHARDRGRLKRGGHDVRVSLTDSSAISAVPIGVDLLALDDALTELGRVDPRKEQVVQLRYFGGFSVEDTAGMLDLSVAQVKRDWVAARAFLLTRLAEREE